MSVNTLNTDINYTFKAFTLNNDASICNKYNKKCHKCVTQKTGGGGSLGWSIDGVYTSSAF